MPLNQIIKGALLASIILAVLAFISIKVSDHLKAAKASTFSTQYGQTDADHIPDAEYSNVTSLSPGPHTPLPSLEPYQTQPDENPLLQALKMDDMLSSLSNIVDNLDTNHSIANGLPEASMDQTDDLANQAAAVNNNVADAYSQIQQMEQNLQNNYNAFNNGSISGDTLNAHSAAMAQNVAAMQQYVNQNQEQLQQGIKEINSINDGMDAITENGRQALDYYGQANDYIQEAKRQFNTTARQLDHEGFNAPGAFGDARSYLSSMQQYVKDAKPYTRSEMNYVGQAKSYMQNTENYLNKSSDYLGKVSNNLGDIQHYFNKAQVPPSSTPRGGLQMPGQQAASSSDACSSIISDDPLAGKGQPLESLSTCQKTCHSGCREEKKAGGPTCYACPSGSPDTCYDVGMFPASMPWCQPGGICYTDPELTCQFMGAIGPNKMPLNCVVCKQLPDDCWQNVGNDTTNLTHCIQTCQGMCTYVGKYQQPGAVPVKFEHCYKCNMGDPSPTCESLKWGSTTQDMCTKDCPNGQCKQMKISIDKDGKGQISDPNAPPPPGNGPNGGNNGGDQGGVCGGGQCGAGGQNGGNNSGGDTTGGGNNNGGGDQGNTPGGTDGPLGGGGDNNGGGGSIAGGGKKSGTGNNGGLNLGGGNSGGNPNPGGGNSGGNNSGPQNPPKVPGNTKEKPPQPPEQNQPKPPDNPNAPTPDAWEVNFYKKLADETKERIKSRDDIINDPKEFQGVKDVAAQQKADMVKTKEHYDTMAKNAQDKVDAQQKEIDDKNKLIENYEKTRPKTVDYATEAKKRGEAYNEGKLKEAANNLKTIVKEAKDSATDRRKRIDDETKEITRLQNENDALSDTVTRGREGSEEAKQRTDENNKRIEELTNDRAYNVKALQKSQAKYKEAIDAAMSQYRTALFRTSEAARQKAETERAEEFYNFTIDKARRKLAQDERNKVFDKTTERLSQERDAAKSRGDTKTADAKQTQIDNIKREQDEWNQTQDRQQKRIDDLLYEQGKRNFDEGAGPWSTESLNETLDKYSKILQNMLNDPNLPDDQKAIAQATLDGIKDKQNNLQNPQLTQEQIQGIDQTTSNVANAAMDKGADPSFFSLYMQSVGEEYIHNLNPLVAAKKDLAFGWGMLKGIGSAVKGAAELGVDVTKLAVQSTAMTLGTDALGTDAVDSLYGVLSTGYDNTNLDGLFKAVDVAVKAVDAQLNTMSKGDIDWNTAEAGGEVAGQLVAQEGMAALAAPKVAGALTKARAFVNGNETAIKVANTIKTAVGYEEAAGVVSKTEQAVNTVTKTEEVANAASQTTEKASGEIAGSNVPETPTDTTPSTEGKTPTENAPGETGQGRSPPSSTEAPTVHEQTVIPPKDSAPDSSYNFKTADGGNATVETGKELGHGSTSKVYVDNSDPTKVVRITGDPNAVKLDATGRKAVESVQKPGGPIRVVENSKTYTVSDPASPLNGKTVEINERVPGGSADKMIEAQGGQMTQGQAEAFDAATNELNKNGYTWMDNHTGNYTFEKVPGTEDKWTVAVIDPGGIVPMKGATTAEKAANAMTLQKRINIHEVDTDKFVKMMKSRGPDAIKNAALAERGLILEKYGDLIDTDAIGLNDAHEVGFYPYGTAEFQNVQDIAAKTFADASSTVDAGAAAGAGETESPTIKIPPPPTETVKLPPVEFQPTVPTETVKLPASELPSEKPNISSEAKPESPTVEGSEARGPPEEAKAVGPSTGEKPVAPEYTPPNGTLPNVTDTTQVKPLDDETLAHLQNKNGFRVDHAERMNTFAQEKKVYLIVRDGNPDSVPYFGNDDVMPKPMSSKAKTAKVGPDIGLVVDPTNVKQTKYWDDAIAEAQKSGDAARLDKLTKARNKALEAWDKYGQGMIKEGYRVNPDTGVIEYVDPHTGEVSGGVHGDYDLHGVYKQMPDGTVEHVSYGSGTNLDANHMDLEGVELRKQLNDAISSDKDFIQHGAQDDWITNNPNSKEPDPPATVFFPDGRPPVTLNNAQEMKDFYENVMGVKFPYTDEAVAKSMAKTATGGE